MDGTFSQASYAPGWAPPPPLPVFSTTGVLRRRLVAYLIDLAIIACLTVLFGALIGVAGVLTFGLGWALYGILIPATAILYSAITVGGRGAGTPGMRLAGLAAIDARSGRPVGLVLAALHAILFYIAAGTFLLLVLDVLIGLARGDRRLGHDLLVGLMLVRRP